MGEKSAAPALYAAERRQTMDEKKSPSKKPFRREVSLFEKTLGRREGHGHGGKAGSETEDE